MNDLCFDQRAWVQVDVILQFFIGIHNEDMQYCDDIHRVLLLKLKSPSGFWFDCITSIPFSYMDLYFHQVLK